MANTYYVAGIPFSNELYHHGIKGQKWGLRRYQNPDGTLTPAGKARYGSDGLGEHANEHGFIRRMNSGDWLLGKKRLGDRAEQMYEKNAQEAEKYGNKQAANMYRSAAKAQKQRNIDRDKYISNTSTGKLVAQNFLLGPIGADNYRVARQQGYGRGKAAVGALLGGNIGSMALDAYRSHKRYGGITV